MSERLLTVVIADDDNLVLKDLMNLIDWKAVGYKIAGTASTGEEAFQCVQRCHPDLLITDILMPGMDGLSLIEKAHQAYPDMKFLITSAYQEFDYARRAMASGVSDYLLKTEITASTLTRKLLEIKNQFTKAGSHAEAQLRNELEQYFSESSPSGVSLDFYPRLQGLSGRKYYFLVISPPELFERNSIQSQEKITSQVRAAAPLFYEAAKEHCAQPIWFISELKIVLGISDDAAVKGQEAPLKGILSHFLFRQPADSSVPYVYFFENRKMTIEEFRPILHENETLITYFLHFNPSRPLPFSSLQALHPIKTDRSFHFHSLIFDEEHEEADILLIKDYLTECLDNYDIISIGDFFMKFCAHMEISTNETMQLPDQFYAETPEALLKWCFNVLHQCIVYHTKGTPESYSPVVENAIRFIKQNYSNVNLTAIDIANSVGLSANRLGVLFKQDTGSTVNEYLNQYRVQRAVEFLEKTNMKIYEISEKCGYKSSQYFSQVIFQKTGKHPIDYRKAKNS